MCQIYIYFFNSSNNSFGNGNFEKGKTIILEKRGGVEKSWRVFLHF